MTSKQPGPDAVFTDRLNIKIRPEQREALERLAELFEITTSELVRRFLTALVEDIDVSVYKQAMERHNAKVGSDPHTTHRPGTHRG